MPYAKNVPSICTGCGKLFLTTSVRAAQERRFHSKPCKWLWQTGKARSDRGSKAIEIECGFCGKPFLAGGRDPAGKRLPHTDAEFCSRLCALRARDVQGQKCRELPDDFKEWLAAYFDGEGSAFFVLQNERKRPYAQMTIGSTDQATIEQIMNVTGVGSILLRKSDDPRYRDLYMWRCFARAAIGCLKQIHSTLTIKSAVVDFVFASVKEMHDDRTLAYDPSWRRKLKTIGKLLNSRGPAGPVARRERRSPMVESRWRKLRRSRSYRISHRLGVVSLLPARSRHKEYAVPGWVLCPVCGEQFKRRTRPTRRNPSQTCSKPCAYIYRKRRGEPCRLLTARLAKRIAGYIDAEGWIGIRASSRTVHVAIHFGNTDQLIVRLLQEAVGLGNIVYRPPKKKTHAESWHWRIQADAAHGLIEQIYPFLKTKRRQAELAMYVQERLEIPESRCNREWQAESVSASHLLNSKGQVKIPAKIKLARGRFTV